MTDVINYEELDYTDDRRVRALENGSVFVTSGVLHSDTDRIASQVDVGCWVVRGATTSDCDLLDPGDRHRTRMQVFGSAEEAVCFIVGAPSELTFDGGEYRMSLLNNEDGTAYIDPTTGLPDVLLVQQWSGPAGESWCAFEEHAAEYVRFYGDTPEAAADAYFGIGS